MDGFFTGIGSRNTPEKYLNILENVSRFIVDTYKLKLRSGHAVGADRACEKGANGFADIYLPWKTYGIRPYKNDPGMEVIGNAIIPEREKEIAEFMCDLVARKPYQEMERGVQLLMERNVNQIIGHTDPVHELSRIVLCYSPDIGGTSYATALARHFDIHITNILNLNLSEVIEEVDSVIPSTSRIKLTKAEILEGIYNL